MDHKSTNDDINDCPSARTNAAACASRSYDCSYCKRGFSTAQALGGHMNIHRKDRALVRNSPGAATSPASPDEREGSCCRAGSTAASVHRIKPLFPLVSEPYVVGYYHPSPPPDHAVGTEEERRQARGGVEVDPEKLTELRRYGRDLGLGRNMQVDHREEEDDEGVKDRVNLKLTL